MYPKAAEDGRLFGRLEMLSEIRCKRIEKRVASSDNRGRPIIITGGGGGIGRATALLCAKRGDRVAILDKNGKGAKQVAEAARIQGAGGAIGLECDVSDEAQVAQAFALIHEQFGAPYGIFANAGIDLGDRMMVFNCRPIHKMAVPIA